MKGAGGCGVLPSWVQDRHRKNRPGAVERGTPISRFSPVFADAYNAAVLAARAGRLAGAEEAFRRLAASWPEAAEPYAGLGGVLQAAGRRDEAIAALRRALLCRPDQPALLFALGELLLSAGRAPAALPVWQRLLGLRLDHPGGLAGLGNCLMMLGRDQQAERAFRLAALLWPGDATILNNLGAARLAQGDTDGGARSYRRAVTVEPRPEYRKNLGTCLLMAGDYAAGAEAYEGRLEQAVWPRRSLPGTPWTGQPLAGRTLLVHFEQGLGDSFQFVRYAPLLQRMGARVVFECQPALKRILATAPGIDRLVAHGEPLPACDHHVSLMSLMHRLDTKLDSIPGGVPYLRAEPALVARWRERLGVRGGELRVGLNWHGSTPARSVPLSCFAPLAGIPGLRLYSLQKVSGLDELSRLDGGRLDGGRLGGALRVEVPGPDYDAGPDAFVDTAAVMESLDLVISCDTSVCHLAGALGRPVWVLLRWFADWRWMRGREDTPWYPTMRLVRQPSPGDWAGAVALVAERLEAMVRERRAAGAADEGTSCC